MTGEEVPTFIQDWAVTPGGTIPVKMITVANTYTRVFRLMGGVFFKKKCL